MYGRPGLPVKSSQTRLWIGCSNVETTVDASGEGTTLGKTLNPLMKKRSSSVGSIRSTAKPSRPARDAASASMPKETVFVPVTA